MDGWGQTYGIIEMKSYYKGFKRGHVRVDPSELGEQVVRRTLLTTVTTSALMLHDAAMDWHLTWNR